MNQLTMAEVKLMKAKLLQTFEENGAQTFFDVETRTRIQRRHIRPLVALCEKEGILTRFSARGRLYVAKVGHLPEGVNLRASDALRAAILAGESFTVPQIMRKFQVARLTADRWIEDLRHRGVACVVGTVRGERGGPARVWAQSPPAKPPAVGVDPAASQPPRASVLATLAGPVAPELPPVEESWTDKDLDDAVPET